MSGRQLRDVGLSFSFMLTFAVGGAAQGRFETSPSAAAGQHTGHAAQKPSEDPKPATTDQRPEQGQHHHPASGDPAQDLPPFIPRISDEDRTAAFPDVEGHTVHDEAVHSFVLLDQLEWQVANASSGLNLDARGWIGRDRDRLWFRGEGATEDGRLAEAQAHVLFGRQFARWWDIVGGVRQDFRPGSAQTWAAIGVQGLAPYWFEVEATAYVGGSGRTHVRFEVEYELLLTNRLIIQPLLEANVFGKSDLERGIGAGVSTTEAGFRLRYEMRREMAPYVGVTWATKWGKTADFARAANERTGGARFVAGLRLWF